MNLLNKFNKYPKTTALLSGILLSASYPPLPFGFLSALVWIPMLSLINKRTNKDIFRFFFIFGFSATLGTVYWIGNVVPPGLWALVLIGLFLICSYFALFYSIIGLWAKYLIRTWSYKSLIFLPPLWAILEYIQGLGEISFPWNAIAYTWGNYLPLIQGLSVVGIYGYSFLILEIGVTIFLLLKYGIKDRFTLYVNISVSFIVILLFINGLFFKKENTNASKATVSIIQSNIDQLVKWDEAFLDSTVSVNIEMTKKACKISDKKPDLIIWSETSLPMYIKKRPVFLNRIYNLSKEINTPLLLGSLDYERVDTKYKDINFYNCAFFLKSDTSNMLVYKKNKLVPFSEYLPFSGIIPILNLVDLGEADFSQGTEQKIYSSGKIHFSPSICYEIIYPNFIRNMVKSGANLLVNITNDGWFGRSSAPFQHLNIARFRCIENNISLARCANTGISAIIKPNGVIEKSTKIMNREILNGKVILSNNPTFYSKHGNWLVIVCLLIFLTILILSIIKNRR